MATRKLWLVAAALVASLGLIAAGCGDDDETTTEASNTATQDGGASADAGGDQTFVGKVADSNAYIAIVTNPAADQVAGYVCDGKDVSLWIGASPLEGGSGELLARSDSKPFGEVVLTADAAEGEVEIDGETHSFTTKPASGDAGLYEQTDGEGADYYESGWVVLANDDYRGVKRTATTTTSAGSPSGKPVGWIDPDIDPAKPPGWIDPEIDP